MDNQRKGRAESSSGDASHKSSGSFASDLSRVSLGEPSLPRRVFHGGHLAVVRFRGRVEGQEVAGLEFYQKAGDCDGTHPHSKARLFTCPPGFGKFVPVGDACERFSPRYPTPVLEGFLKKQGGSVKTWKTRWVVAEASCKTLMYFGHPRDKEPKGRLALATFRVVEGKSTDNKLFWELHPLPHAASKRVFVFQCDSSGARSAWMQAAVQCGCAP